MKKNLIKSLKSLLKAYGGENSNKNNAVQIIDEITETLGGETASKSKNLVEAIDKLSNQVSESSGGGNPNYVQTINGTWADPWGDVDSAELARAISDRSATAYFRMPYIGDMPIKGEADEVASALMVSVTLVEAGTPPDLTQLIWIDNVFEATGYDRESGTCVDRTDSYSSYESTVTIVWHPLPEQQS